MVFVNTERRANLAELRDSAAAFHLGLVLEEANRRHVAEIGGLKIQLAEAKSRLS